MLLRLDIGVTASLCISSILAENQFILCNDSFEGLFAAFDAILILRTQGRQQSENFVSRAVGARKSEAWREFNFLPDPVAVFAALSVDALS
jgi:hypothetical protein